MMSLVFFAIIWAANPTATILNPSTDYTFSAGTTWPFSAFSYDEGGASYTYHWSVSTGESFEGQSIDYTFTEPGSYSFSVVARDPSGLESEAETRNIYINDPQDFNYAPVVQKIIPSRRIVHAETSFSVTAATSIPSDPPLTYLWFWHDGTRASRAEGETVRVSFDNPVPINTEHPVSLILRDAKGRYSWPGTTNIYVGEGNLPPEGRIVSPGNGLQITPGTSVEFVGSAFDNEGDEPFSYQWFKPDGAIFDGQSFTYTFETVGYFYATLMVTDSHGNQDPAPVSVYITVAESSSDPPITTIIFPELSTKTFTGESLFFMGFAQNGNSATIQGSWTISEVTGSQIVTTYQGSQTGRIPFSQKGLYHVTFDASDNGLTSSRTRHNTRWVVVGDRGRLEEQPLRFKNPGLDVVRDGTVLNLELDLSNQNNRVSKVFWMADGKVLNEKGGQISYTVHFPESYDLTQEYSGLFNLQFEAVAFDGNNQPVSSPAIRNFNVYKDVRPPNSSLSGYDMGETLFFPKGSSFEPVAIIDNPENLALDYTWKIIGIGNLQYFMFDTLQTGPIKFDNPGLFSLSLAMITTDQSLSAGRTIFNYIQIYDPALTPDTQITQPATSGIALDSGTSARFEGFVSEPSFVKSPNPYVTNEPVTNALTWVHESPAKVETSYQTESLELQFNEVGFHRIRLETTNSLGLTDPTPDVRVILVESADDPDRFEPNNTIEQAASMGPGQLTNLELNANDPVDWYYLDVNQTGTTLQFRFDLSQSDQEIQLDVFTEDQVSLQSQVLEAGKINHFTLRSPRVGTYFLRFQIPQNKQIDGGLSFGVGINSLKPQLSYPYVYHSELNPFRLHIINPGTQAGEIVLEARNPFGELIGESHQNMAASGKFEADVKTVFPEAKYLEIAWIQVQSDLPLIGVGTQISTDNQTGIAEPAIQGGFEELIIPHIAQLTQQWYTLAAVTNNTAFDVQPLFSTPLTDYTMDAPRSSYESNDFDFLDFFGGTIPDDGKWGRFTDQSAEKSLAGWELFGKIDGNLQSAAISMIPPRLKNPNFTYVRRDLYFPHIASDTASFWTGVAFVNTSDGPAVGNLKAYNDSGVLLAEVAIELSAGDKKVDLVPNFFPSLPVETPIAWMVLETSDFFQGFELFGSNDGTNRRLAGFPAAQGAGMVLHFPNVYSNLDAYWTGLAVVNISETATVLTYEGYDENGTLLISSNRPVEGRKKDVALVEDIFSTVPTSLAWVRVTSTQPIAAFELFGDRASNFMAGSLAQ